MRDGAVSRAGVTRPLLPPGPPEPEEVLDADSVMAPPVQLWKMWYDADRSFHLRVDLPGIWWYKCTREQDEIVAQIQELVRRLTS